MSPLRARALESNFWKIAVVRIAKSSMLFIPILVLFFQQVGMSVQDIFFLQALFSVMVFVAEVPSGYLADRFGRKTMIVSGFFLYCIGFTVYCFAYDFWGCLGAELLLGIGYACISGADAALICDTLIEQDEGGRYQEVYGRNLSFGHYAEAVSSFIGGIIATVVSLRFPFYCQAILFWLIFPVTWFLVEPAREKLSEGSVKSAFKKMWEVTRFALHEHKKIKWLCIYSAVAGASTLTMVWFIQLYQKQVGVSIVYFGSLWALYMLCAALFSAKAHAISRILGERKALYLFIILPVAGYVMVGTFAAVWAVAFIFLFYIARGIHTPILEDVVNRFIGSDVRATVISVKNLGARAVFVVVGPIAGWISEVWSLQFTFWMLALFFGFSGSIALFFLHKHKVL